MNKAGYILALCLTLFGMTAYGQRYERIVRDNFWNESRNVTGIRQDSISRSYAEASGTYRSGEFRDTWEAQKGWSAGAVTASIRHLENLSLKGSFSFRQTEGYGMCGSMFIDPGFYPVDILEFTPGRKTLQTYSFDGGISYDLAERWRIGAYMDFESANISKRKDLRHTNWQLDMTVAPGLMYHNGDFAVGATYIFRKTSESIKAEQIGTAESSYYAFLDKGMMYGVYSVWSGSGLHLSEAGVNGFPVKDFSNGAAMQVQYGGLFAEVEYLATSGTIGEKEYIWFRFPGQEINGRVGFRHKGLKSTHYARVGVSHKSIGMDESILEKVSENGVTTVHNHGSNRIFANAVTTLSPEYEFVADRFELRAGIDVEWEGSLSSQMYPYIYRQNVLTWESYADALLHTGRFDIGLYLAYGSGAVKESDRLANEDSGVQTVPFRLQEWYDKQMEYRTSSLLRSGLSVRYNFLNGIYLKAEGRWTRGLRIVALAGADRLATTLGIGYEF